MTLCASGEEPKAETDRVGAYPKPSGKMMHTGRYTRKVPAHLSNWEVLRVQEPPCDGKDREDQRQWTEEGFPGQLG